MERERVLGRDLVCLGRVTVERQQQRQQQPAGRPEKRGDANKSCPTKALYYYFFRRHERCPRGRGSIVTEVAVV